MNNHLSSTHLQDVGHIESLLIVWESNSTDAEILQSWILKLFGKNSYQYGCEIWGSHTSVTEDSSLLDTMPKITVSSSLWSSIPRRVVLTTVLGMFDSKHEGTVMLWNAGNYLPTYRCKNPEYWPILLSLNLFYQSAYLLSTTKIKAILQNIL
jgi:hypothetical protein